MNRFSYHIPNSNSSFGSPDSYRGPGRAWSDASREYRFGFNGKEEDKEGLGGGGSTYDYGFRIYNTNLGRFLSTDPLFKDFVSLTFYQFSSNCPVSCVDLDGLEAVIYTEGGKNKQCGANDAGHTCIAIRINGELIVYTYGRYSDGDNVDGTSNGILIKYTGEQAEAFLKTDIYGADNDATAFLIEDADAYKIFDEYENLLKSGTDLPKTDTHYDKYKESNGTDKKGVKARVVDKYNAFTGNTCAGKVRQSIKTGGVSEKILKAEEKEMTSKQKFRFLTILELIGVHKKYPKYADGIIDAQGKRIEASVQSVYADLSKTSKNGTDVKVVTESKDKAGSAVPEAKKPSSQNSSSGTNETPVTAPSDSTNSKTP